MTERVLFIGSKRLGLECLKTLQRTIPLQLIGALTIDDRSDSRSVLGDFKAYCGKEGIPLQLAANKREADRMILEWQPQLCFVAGWYWIFDKAILSAVPKGFLGIHNSLLPKYRGNAPLVWSIINGEPEIGFSVFSIEEGMDDGDIWWQRRIPLTGDMTVGDALAQLEAESLRSLGENLLHVVAGTIKPTPQQHAEASYCALRTPEHGLINWNWDARRVHNFIRAQSQPYPGAFTLKDDERITVWKARPFPAPFYGAPGQVGMIQRNSLSVVVCCGNDTALELLEVSDENGGIVPAGKRFKSIKIVLTS